MASKKYSDFTAVTTLADGDMLPLETVGGLTRRILWSDVEKLINNLGLYIKVGKVVMYDDYYDPAADFPYFCLSNNDQTLTTTHWPDLVPHLRGKKLRYMAGTTSAKFAFDVTTYAISSNVATLTFANTTAENKILAALAEDQLVHGSFTSWRTITLPSAIGSISAGTYAITAISASSRTVSFAYTATNASGSVTSTAEFYPHRLSTADDSGGTQARHFAVQGRGFFTPNESSAEFIGSLRRRDRMQSFLPNFDFYGYSGSANDMSHSVATIASAKIVAGVSTNQGPYNMSDYKTQMGLEIVSDGTNGTPRKSDKTHGPGYGVFAYIWAKTYVA